MAAIAAIAVLYLGPVLSIQEMMFQKTENMTTSSWESFWTSKHKTTNFYMCAAQCLKGKENCNSWHFDEDEQNCQLGKVFRGFA